MGKEKDQLITKLNAGQTNLLKTFEIAVLENSKAMKAKYDKKMYIANILEKSPETLNLKRKGEIKEKAISRSNHSLASLKQARHRLTALNEKTKNLQEIINCTNKELIARTKAYDSLKNQTDTETSVTDSGISDEEQPTITNDYDLLEGTFKEAQEELKGKFYEFINNYLEQKTTKPVPRLTILNKVRAFEREEGERISCISNLKMHPTAKRHIELMERKSKLLIQKTKTVKRLQKSQKNFKSALIRLNIIPSNSVWYANLMNSRTKFEEISHKFKTNFSKSFIPVMDEAIKNHQKIVDNYALYKGNLIKGYPMSDLKEKMELEASYKMKNEIFETYNKVVAELREPNYQRHLERFKENIFSKAKESEEAKNLIRKRVEDFQNKARQREIQKSQDAENIENIERYIKELRHELGEPQKDPSQTIDANQAKIDSLPLEGNDIQTLNEQAELSEIFGPSNDDPHVDDLVPTQKEPQNPHNLKAIKLKLHNLSKMEIDEHIGYELGDQVLAKMESGDLTYYPSVVVGIEMWTDGSTLYRLVFYEKATTLASNIRSELMKHYTKERAKECMKEIKKSQKH